MRHAAATVIGTVAGTSLLIAAKLATNPPDGGLVGNDASAKEALQAQSGNIATVSGATYANGAYKTSLAAALDAAHG